MLTITAPVFDIDGHVLLTNVDPDGLSGLSRRNSRVATLDGMSAINDFGYSDSDRTLNVRWSPESQFEIERMSRMVKSYSRLIVSFAEGVFIGAPESFGVSGNVAQLIILVERRLDT